VIPHVSALSSPCLHEPVCSFPSVFPSASSPCAPLLCHVPHLSHTLRVPHQLLNSTFHRTLHHLPCMFSSCFLHFMFPLFAHVALLLSHASYSVHFAHFVHFGTLPTHPLLPFLYFISRDLDTLTANPTIRDLAYHC